MSGSTPDPDPLWGTRLVLLLISLRSTKLPKAIIPQSTHDTITSAFSEAQDQDKPLPHYQRLLHFNTVWSNSPLQFVDTLVDISRTS